MAISPQDARRWADRLELARSLGNRWSLAEFGSYDSLIYLVADGAYSTSIGPHHWSNQLQDKLADGACPGMVRSFSYFSYGHHYLPDHTVQLPAVLRSAWVATLDHLRPGQRVIPICFSLGAAVAMLGTMDWLSQAADHLEKPNQVIDAALVARQEFLGTHGLKATVDRALLEVIALDARRWAIAQHHMFPTGNPATVLPVSGALARATRRGGSRR
jgi:hypothetical protein